MDDREAIQIMERASSEIRDLRSQIARFQPKADAYDVICMILDMLPRRSQGEAPDVTWLFDKRVKELREQSDKHDEVAQ